MPVRTHTPWPTRVFEKKAAIPKAITLESRRRGRVVVGSTNPTRIAKVVMPMPRKNGMKLAMLFSLTLIMLQGSVY